MVMAFIFILGFFLDFIEITYIHIPIIAPIVVEYGYDPLWFGIMFAVNLQTSFMTPPFGPSLFYLKGVFAHQKLKLLMCIEVLFLLLFYRLSGYPS